MKPAIEELLKSDRAWVGASEFAEAMGVSSRQVRRWCVAQLLPCGRRGLKLWFVNVRALRRERNHMLARVVEEAMIFGSGNSLDTDPETDAA
jgi:hypothetical protein